MAGGSLLVGGLGHDPGPTASARPLQGTVWQITSYGNTHPTAGNPTTFVIGTDGAVVVDDACTVVGARADLDRRNHQLDLVDVSQRAKACVDECGPTLDKQGLDALLQLFDWKISGDTLTLQRVTGSGRVTMRATTLPAPTPRPAHPDRHGVAADVGRPPRPDSASRRGYRANSRSTTAGCRPATPATPSPRRLRSTARRST